MTLKQFLVRISTDPDALARFIADPDGELLSNSVPEVDRLLLHMGNAAVLQAALTNESEAVP